MSEEECKKCDETVDRAVKQGDIACIKYTGKLDSGEVFDTSEGREPLEFEAGSGKVIKGFDDAVKGMKKAIRRLLKYFHQKVMVKGTKKEFSRFQDLRFQKNLNQKKV